MGTRQADRHKALSLQCPDESILLAYTRNQKIENPLSIRLHIERCRPCHQKYDEYERLNATLDVLASIQSNLSYPEPVAYQVMDVIRGGKRQSKQQINKAPALSIRVASIPIALLLTMGALIVVTAVAAFALMHAGNGAQVGSTHQFGNGQRSATVVISQRPLTPRPGSTRAPVPALSPTPTADPTAVLTPYIVVCSTQDDSAHSRLRICGHNFTPGDQVALVVKMPGSAGPKQRPQVVVDAQGTFQDSFIINNCKVPLAIFARDLNNPVNTNILQNIPFANCPVSTPSGRAG